MKKSMLLIMMCIAFSIVHAQKNNENVVETNVEFDKLVHDFGIVNESGGMIECDFIVTNNGEKPLVVTRVSAGCGCTVPNWTKEPIQSGEKGFVKVTFDPKGRSGNFTKSLTVFTTGNTSPIRLNIKGTIEQAAVAQK